MKFKILYGAFIATVLTACGGGGGGSSDSGGSGGGGGGGTTPANNAPAFSSSDAASVLEGQTAVVTVEASDEDSDTLTYTLSGDDAALFSLSDSNQLAFLAAPDFEVPGDAGADNVYSVVVTVDDGTDSVTQTLSITVLDAFEGRVIDGPVSGATVFVDVDGDYVADSSEPTATTDSNGLFFIEKGDVSISSASKLISIGGTDTTTNTTLPDLALVSDVPTAATASAFITPLSTIVAAAATPEAKVEVLTALGISATDLGADATNAAAVVQAFVTKDVWAQAVAGNAVAQAIQTKNVQMAEVFVSAVSVADTSDAATSVSRAVTMTKSVAAGLVTQAASGKTIIESATAQNGTVTFTLVDAVVADALVSAVQAYTTDAAIVDTSLDTLAAETDALKAFATDVTVLVTHLTDQLNFSDITGTAAEGAITSAKSSADQAVTTIVSAVTAADTADLVIYAAGGSTSSIVVAVNTLKTDLGVDSSTGGGSTGGGSSGGGSTGGGGSGGGGSGVTPSFTTAGTLSILEGGTAAVTVQGTGTITMTGGADLSKFTLSSENALTFNVATDYETPLDSGADNVYNVTLTATSGSETATLDLAITVLDAFEGRVIDGPVSGATVYVDVDGDYVQDADEPSGTTDVSGLFFVGKGDVTISSASKLISVGGTDTTTNKALPDLALVSDVPTTASASANITPISTIIAAAATPAAKVEVLTSLGISAADVGADASDAAAIIEAFIAKDVWAESVAGDAVAQSIQTKNVQMTEVLVSAVNVADTSDATSAASRAVAMTKSFAVGLVAQAASGAKIMNTETALDGTVTIKVVETVVSDALVTAVQTYAADTTVTDTSLDTLAADSDALTVFASDITEIVTQVTDQLNFTDITDVSTVTVILAAKESAEDAVDTISAAVVAADATELASYAAGSSSSSIAASVTAVEADVVATVATAVTSSSDDAAADAAKLTNTGYSLPETISVLETVE